jgi:hypothetical protein
MNFKIQYYSIANIYKVKGVKVYRLNHHNFKGFNYENLIIFCLLRFIIFLLEKKLSSLSEQTQ